MTEPAQKNLTQCNSKLNLIRTLIICSKMDYSCCFSKGGYLDFLQKSFITLTTAEPLFTKQALLGSSQLAVYCLPRSHSFPIWVRLRDHQHGRLHHRPVLRPLRIEAWAETFVQHRRVCSSLCRPLLRVP